MAQSISTSSLTTFISLNALQCDQLAQFIMGSITCKQGDADSFECATEAIKLCEETLDVLHTFRVQTKNKNSCKPSTKMKLSVKPNRISNLPRDVLFAMCDYLDSFSKAHLRFTSMSTHIDMMGCPLDLIQLTIYSSRSVLNIAKSHAPLRMINHQPKNFCGCGASRQLQLIDFGTAEVDQTLCSDLTESQLSLLGIGRSWSISGMLVGDQDDSTARFMEMSKVFKKHNAYRSLKQLTFILSDENRDVNDALSTCGITGYVEDLVISTSMSSLIDSSFSVSLGVILPSLKRLRRVRIFKVSIDGSLNDFVKYCPQIKELDLYNITGDIACLAQLKNSLRKLEIKCSIENVYENSVHGDVSSLSSCTKLTELVIDSISVTGNISSLNTLTNLEVLDFESTKVNGKIESLLKYLPDLNLLSLWDNSNLTGDLSSLTHLKKLRECYIASIPQLKGDISVMSCLPKLKRLELASLPNITGDASLFSDIERYDVKNCDNIEGSL